jgi:rRNA maturation RNase YbeY
MKGKINFETNSYYDFRELSKVKNWIKSVIKYYGFNYSEINYSFYDDEGLLEINKTYLNHDFYTDIITFDNTINKTISADIAISLDRVKENASTRNTFENELLRVLVHGVLHCMGFNDKTEEEQRLMRIEEDKMLNMFHVEHFKTEDNV